MSSDGDVPMMDAESQSQDIDFIQILANMKTENKRRKEAKRKVIEAEYQKKAQIANERIAAITKAHEEKVEKLQEEQFETLRTLLHQRQLEENAIWKSIKRIEAAKTALAESLEQVYERRLEMILEVETTGRLTADASVVDW